MTVEVVFFDAGETLLRPEPSFPELARTVLAARGHDVSPDDVLEGARAVAHHFRTAADARRYFSTSADESYAFWTALYRDMIDAMGLDDPAAPDVLYATFSDLTNYGLFPDSLSCLRELASMGYRLGVISNFEGWLRDLLGRLGVLDMFDVVAVSGLLGVEKPDRKIFEWAVGEAGVAPSACAHVGDQPFFDAEAAEACGLRGILLDRHGRWGAEQRFTKIGGLDELAGVLG